MVTLTFIAIMKNESRIIQRCLDSVKSVVDHIVISDTGSTDNTVDLIKNWLKDNNIPGDVYNDEWKNFGVNRTLSVKNGQDWLKKNKVDLKTNYFLTIDGDMLLQVEPTFDKQKLLTNTHWQIRQKTFDMTYYNTRLMRSDLPFKAVSVTHEFWACDDPPVQDRGTLNDLWCVDIGDGGAKADKFERDIKLLTQGLIDEPKNERYLFYLAQSYDCAGDKEKGLEFYEKRVVAGGWVEEVFITFKRIGECCMELAQKLLNTTDVNNPTNFEKLKLKQVKIYQEHAMNSWLLGYEMIPTRGETLYKAINVMRLSGKNNMAMMLLKTGLKLEYPEDMLLFVEHPVYEYKFIEELSIVAHYVKKPNLGRAACDYLILYNCVPSHVRNNTFNNYFYYLEKMNWYRYIKLVNRKFEEYIPSSSCLFPVADKPSFLEGVIRAVNYSINKQFQYTMRDPKGVVRTKNYWGKFNLENLSETTFHEIAYSSECNKPVRTSHINGLEDLRIVKTLDGKIYGMAVDWEFGKNNHPSIVIAHFKKSKKDKYLINKVVPTKYKEDECQKNWVPFVVYNKLYAIFSHHPLRILEINPDDGECKLIIEKFSQYNLEHIRGSSIPIQLTDGSWLVVVHEVIQKDTRKYIHRLLKYSKEWDLLDITYPFYFQNLFVEFCLSLFVVDKTLSIVFSTEDNSTEMVSIEMSKINWIPRKLKTWIADNC
jgi:glycosyltransferase involved in cell wall biosynthesis